MNLWKRKLAAYLHDPPSKCLDIRTHSERSDAAFRQAGFVDEEVGQFFPHADHTGAAADRLPFPKSSPGSLSCAFDGVRNAFRHPLHGGQLPFHAEFKSVEQAMEGEFSVQPRLTDESLASLGGEPEQWRARFFAHWRLWPHFAAEHDYRLGLLPADTRIPDHTIWTHMQVVSALAGCGDEAGRWRPAFLRFQLGPVQDFIAAARSIRDLWSGSYLLSWLMAAGLKALSEEVGPDAVVFPNLWGQPLFDLRWREELWNQVRIGGEGSCWTSLKWNRQKGSREAWGMRDLLTPSLPNVFLAVVPAERATALGERVAAVIQHEWNSIAQAVWSGCEQVGLTADEPGIGAEERRQRFQGQTRRFLSISWQATPWPETLDAAMRLAGGFEDGMPIRKAADRVRATINMATSQMPVDHRDERFYTDATKTRLSNIGLGWSVILAFNGWQLDAVRQTRAFAAAGSGGWEVGTFSNKDALTGREEAAAGGREWRERASRLGARLEVQWGILFKRDDWLGAPTLIKRLWHRLYLADTPWKLRTDREGFPMPNTRGVAAHEPLTDAGDDESSEDLKPEEKYFAVLAFDGDEIGKWLSGEKAPQFGTQLADYRDGSGKGGFGAKPYFDRGGFKGFLETQRPLSPSYHLQLSEALGNFALRCAGPIVEAYDGRLVYAGGDDVVALLPADTALACARALRAAFQGAEVKGADDAVLFSSPAPGFLTSEQWKDQSGRSIPFLVPGPAADCSVGVAMAHFKSPLQDAVREARCAEKRAKRELERGGLGRGAVAVTLMKRSGETIEWGCRWDNGGLEAAAGMLVAIRNQALSAKFPHRIVELVTGYAPEASGSHGVWESDPAFEACASEILRREVGTAAARQRGKQPSEEQARQVQAGIDAYLDGMVDGTGKGLEARVRVCALIGLCQTVAFLARNLSAADMPTPGTDV